MTIYRSRLPLAACLIAVLVVLAFPKLAVAWNATGHRTVAEIAWENMTPRARAKAVELLMHGPPAAQLASLRPTTGADADRDRALFLNAATWPDLIRRQGPSWHAYDHPTWHYADFYWEMQGGVAHDIPGTGPDSQNAGERLAAFEKSLSDPATPDTTRAVELAWVVHLTGDIHQPLHTSSLITPEHPLPLGDKGGNEFMLAGGQRLHSYWDDILDRAAPRGTGEDSLAYATRLAQLIERQHPQAAFVAQINTNFTAWEHEGLVLTQGHVYRGITVGAPVSDAYQSDAFETSKTQIALAGYRLAAWLNRALK